MVKESCVVVKIRNYAVVNSEVVEGDLATVVKGTASSLIREWDPERGDFMVLKDDRTISIKLPLPSPQLYDTLKRFNLRRVGNEAEATIPVYEIIYSGSWSGDELRVEEVVVVMPNLTDELNKQIIGEVIEALKGGGFEE